MSRMMLFLFVAVVLFSVAAGASWYLQKQNDAEGDHAKNGDAHLPGAKSISHGTQPKGQKSDPSESRPIVRPPSSLDSERLAQTALSLQRQQESLKNRELILETREKQMDLIHENIKKDQKRLDAIRKEIAAELQLVQDKLEQLEKRSAEVEVKRKDVAQQVSDFDSKKVEMAGTEAANIKKLAAIYDKMDPEAAAVGITQMVEKGKIEMAVGILSNMGQRQAATLLSEVSKEDPSIAIQLFDRMRFAKTSVSSANK